MLVLAVVGDAQPNSSVETGKHGVFDVGNQDTNGAGGAVTVEVGGELDGEVGRLGWVGQPVSKVQQTNNATVGYFSQSIPLSAIQVPVSSGGGSVALKVVFKHVVEEVVGVEGENHFRVGVKVDVDAYRQIQHSLPARCGVTVGYGHHKWLGIGHKVNVSALGVSGVVG